jgi:hypothetical protein
MEYIAMDKGFQPLALLQLENSELRNRFDELELQIDRIDERR